MRNKMFFRIITLILISITLINCEKEETPPNNNNNPPPVPTGNLQIFVRQDQAAGVYIGGANVYLYKTKSDRDSNIVFKVSSTPTEDITLMGAIFEKLTFQKYYLKATYSHTGNDYKGIGESYCPVNVTTSYHVVCTKK